MAMFGLVFALPAAVSRRAARFAAKGFFRLTFLLLRAFCGVRVEVRGPVPRGPALIAGKHQSMLDVFMLYEALPEARFVMKRELVKAPVFGWYALRVGTVPVDRGGGSEAMREMVARMSAAHEEGGQLVIYPQGTRTPPGETRPYKIGVHALYETTGLPCIPAAANTGMIWPKGVAIHPGVAVVEFLPEIAPGMARAPFMAILEREIERASDALAADA
ncbi:MAG: 1-acyl-sn-glycerol-3-phosphate acyltransferase [Rhodobacteraceae bacterium]|nr:MAG: 1-acyl-sn-glycerol-3-phosphate acyltransferase [Paracoccaceae bacterium]